MKIEAVIWDMDGVLIESEPFWQEVEIEVFGKLGIEMTHKQSVETIGMRLDAVVQYRYEQTPWPQPPTLEMVVEDILQGVMNAVRERGMAKQGVFTTLEFLKQKSIPMAIASSSFMRLIETVVERLDLRGYFELLYSAEYEPFGKPHPGVYISAAQKLGIAPQKCLVIEDSMRGVLAAKAAEMFCVAVPDPSLVGDTRLAIADRVLTSLDEFDQAFWESITSA